MELQPIRTYSPGQRIVIALILLIASAIYCSISLVNHYLFRTSAYDLGIYNNIIYSYAHFSVNHTPIQYPEMDHLFGDHFEPVMALIAPFSYLFGTYTLLIFQIAAIISGAIGAMIYVKEKTGDLTLSVFALGHFCSIWGIYSALGFDYHNNVVAAMLVPWVFVFFNRGQQRAFWLMLVLVLLCKENMSLWMCFTGIGLAIHYRKEKLKVRTALWMSLASAVYFICVMKLLIPYFSPEGKSHYIAYYWRLGETTDELFHNLFGRPSYIFALLFENPSNEGMYNGIKSELNFMTLFSGGIFLLYRPSFLVMLIPIFAQKLFIEDYSRWGINNHYSIELVPILCFASAVFLASVSNLRLRYVLAALLVYCTLSVNISKIDERVSLWYYPIYTRFYHAAHYEEKGFDVKKMHQHLATVIPDDASVCAQNNLVPQLAFRDKIYMYPRINDAQYIALAPGTTIYPYRSYEDYQAAADTLAKSIFWEKAFDDRALILYKRK